MKRALRYQNSDKWETQAIKKENESLEKILDKSKSKRKSKSKS